MLIFGRRCSTPLRVVSASESPLFTNFDTQPPIYIPWINPWKVTSEKAKSIYKFRNDCLIYMYQFSLLNLISFIAQNQLNY